MKALAYGKVLGAVNGSVDPSSSIESTYFGGYNLGKNGFDIFYPSKQARTDVLVAYCTPKTKTIKLAMPSCAMTKPLIAASEELGYHLEAN
ncbi:MAG: hypothetical protein JW716_02260 [Candidatus Aenigmarchaeota archaeon]|nr:hypothetical protein [Candidatus Aenigmarchaeota archaeon]